MTETEKKLDRKEVAKLPFFELVKYANEQGIDTYGKTKQDILMALGLSERDDVIVYERTVTSEKLKEIQNMKRQMPMNTVIPKKDFTKWIKIIEKHPLAFNGVDLSDTKTEIVHVLDRDVECECGTGFRIPDDTDMAFCPGAEDVIVINGQREPVRVCMGDDKFRKFIFHEVPE